MKTASRIKKITLMAVLVAMGYVSLFIIRFPLIPSASFLRFDIKDVFITIGGLVLGPTAAFLGGVVISLIQILTVSEYGIIGLIMNLLSVSSFVMPIALAYKAKKNNVSLVIGLLLGCACMTATMVAWNYLISPLYMGVSREVVAAMLLPVFLPFNAIKSIINAVTIFVVWQIIKRIV